MKLLAPVITSADPWSEVCAARLPTAALPALAPLRNREEVRVFPAGEVVWVRWPPPQPDVVRCLLAVSGAVFFVHQAGEWRRFKRRLNSSETPPTGEGHSIASLLGPTPFDPINSSLATAQPIRLHLVRCGQPMPVAALACRIAELSTWADQATTLEIKRVRAARSGDRALLLGSHLPSIPVSVRYWGSDVLVPLGFRPEPDLPAAALRDAIGAATDEIVVLSEQDAERIPRAVFHNLTRAALRLAQREGGAP